MDTQQTRPAGTTPGECCAPASSRALPDAIEDGYGWPIDAEGLLRGALNAASIDALASTADNVLVAKVLDTHQGRDLLRLAALGIAAEADHDPPETIAQEAHRMVHGDRETDYGHPREDFTRQAILWTGLLHHKLADGEYIEAEDIARCMVAVKLARDVHSPKRDNRVDGAGYFIALDRLRTGQ